MQAQIGVESIPDETKRKPQPDPWLALFGHLGVQPDCSWIFENSAGGIISGFRANSHVAASTANLPPLIARFLDKLRREPVLANGFVSFVPSWNHVTLAA
jgi:beta-phosphoglucomutase-like phosphatase (HAD superfamily)